MRRDKKEIAKLIYERLGMATIPPFIRARKTESKVYLKFLDKVMNDEDVKKTIGWALGEVAKKDAKVAILPEPIKKRKTLNIIIFNLIYSKNREPISDCEPLTNVILYLITTNCVDIK